MNSKIALEALSQEMDSLRYSLAEMIEKANDLSPEQSGEIQDRIRRLHREIEQTAMDLGIARPIKVGIMDLDGTVEAHDVVFPIFGKDERSFWRIEDLRDKLVVTRIVVEFEIDVLSNCIVLRHSIEKGIADFLSGDGADYWLGRGEHEFDSEKFEKLLGMVSGNFKSARLVSGRLKK